MMMRSESMQRVQRAIATSVAEIMPGVDAASISFTAKLADYGCNSIDRAEIVWRTLEDLGLDIPAVEFAGVADLHGLAELLCRHLAAR